MCALSLKSSSWWGQRALATLLLLAGILAPSIARADGADLFAPVPSNKLADATPAETKRVEQMNKRPSTAALNLVRVNAAALRGAKTNIALPGDGTLSLAGRSIDVKKADSFTWIAGGAGTPVSATLVVLPASRPSIHRASRRMVRSGSTCWSPTPPPRATQSPISAPPSSSPWRRRTSPTRTAASTST